MCDSCQQVKSYQLPYPMPTSVYSKHLELVFSDLWEAAPDSVGRKKYYVSFIDVFSKFTWVYLLQFKSEVFQKFTEFQTMVQRLFNTKLIAIQTDGGGEYQKMNSFLAQKGIIHYLSCPHEHKQNSPAERKHRHIIEVALALLAQASMPLKFWDETVTTATYLINHTPSKVLNFSSPMERLFKQ
jgi:IS30 family transposase